ncbi:MAG: hypothetical protein JKY08_04120 [Flavobacteriaceae bacterium]|nr:hypothetical protein [Flavobacteriaceae bacterium]
MGKVSTVIELDLEIGVIYKYLENKYHSERYKKACIAVKGYIPDIELLESMDDEKLLFKVKGYDPLLRIHMGSWKWSYTLKELGEYKTAVTFCYEWSVLMELFSLGTIKSQAGNELVESVLALEALEQALVSV